MGSEAVKVVVRCRPLNEREKAQGSRTVLSVEPRRGQCFIQRPAAADEPPKQFTFDGAYFTEHSTEQMYNEVAYPLVEGVTEGYNGTIFAYGQTGSGKSFTMQGVTEPPAQRGVIPRAFEHVFESIQCAENSKFLVRASYLEIYNEEIRDLLGCDTKQRLELKEHPERGVYVRDLSLHTVHSVGECEGVIDQGWRNRAVGYTLMNKDSSRSHSIFTIHLEICNTDVEGKDHLRAGKLNLVDLAGSERQSKTGATGERLREATKINLSLSALGNVISALVDGRSKYIPYRDSKLTRLLQDSLGGNTRTLMIACLSPADSNYEETLSTLRYANRAKSIQNRPRINEDPKDALLRQYQEEIKKLRALISGQMGGPQLPASDQPPQAPPAVPPKPESDNTEAEKEKIKKEYEEKLAKLQADYNAEQESKAKLQEDISVLLSSYRLQLSNLEKQQQQQQQAASRGSSATNNVVSGCGKQVAEEEEEEPCSTDDTSHNVSAGDAANKAAVSHAAVGVQISPDGAEHMMERPEVSMETEKLDQKHALERLQQLEQEVVGGEQARNTELQQRQRQRKRVAHQRELQLLKALSEDGEESQHLLYSVYNSIQEELHAKNNMLLRVQAKMKAAKLEIRDLQAEFENERDDYLASIRRQQREGQLLQALLERMATLVRRDCNYSSVERLKREALWDEDAATWRLPDVTVQKTTLPSAAVAPKPSAQRGADGGEAFAVEEDRYKEMLDRSDSENIASSYFKPKRATQLLGGGGASRGHAGHSPTLLNGTPHHLAANGASMSPDAVVPRPFRLESLGLPPPVAKVKRKKSRNQTGSDAT